MLRDSNTAKHDQHLWPCLSFLSGVVDTAAPPPPPQFSKEDLQRVGLSDEAHPSKEAALYAPSGASLAESFASFLEAGAEERTSNVVPPAARRTR